MATIKDVAKHAGVSISTASYALNNIPNVHPDTKARILQAAKILNYTPHFSARHLKTKKTGNIGVFIYGFSGPVFSDVLEGIRQTLQQYDYNILVSSGKSSESLLREKQVDGAIIFDANLSFDILKPLAENGMPMILLDRDELGKNMYQHMIDNEALVFQLMNDVLSKNTYQTFGFLSGPDDSFNANKRYEGFKRALNTHGIQTHQLFQGDFTIEGGHQIGKRFKHLANPPEFVFCANDESAIGFLQALKLDGFKIPEDIGIAGFDNFFMTSYIHPSVTTIGIDHIKWGKQVATAIMDILRGLPHDLKESPEGTIYWRESC